MSTALESSAASQSCAPFSRPPEPALDAASCLSENKRMIRATSELANYQTCFSDGNHQSISDAATDNGGGGTGFRPHDLLEAALANCLNITIRMYANRHSIPLRQLTTKVDLDRTRPDETVFRYEVALEGELTPEQKQKLLSAAKGSPVLKTLLMKISVERASDTTSP